MPKQIVDHSTHSGSRGKQNKLPDTSFQYNFPLKSLMGDHRQTDTYGLQLQGVGEPFLVLESKSQLERREALLRLSSCLSLIGLFRKEGYIARPGGGIGGFYETTLARPASVTISEHTRDIFNKLESLDGGYQVQSRFTLSHACAFRHAPESASIEFFKIIELFIKHQAWSGRLNPSACKKVKSEWPKLFDLEVKTSLSDERILSAETTGMIWKLKDARNRFIGHGGIDPVIATEFDDPEKCYKASVYAEFWDDPETADGQQFFERYMYDVEVVATILFCKMNDLAPIFTPLPGCWWQPTPEAMSVLAAEGVNRMDYMQVMDWI